MPPTYTSKNHEVEIAISVVNMGRDDRGVIYKFTYEATRARKMTKNRLSGLPRPNSPKTSMIPRHQNYQQKTQISGQKPQISNQQPQPPLQQPQAGRQELTKKQWRNANDYAYVSKIIPYNLYLFMV